LGRRVKLLPWPRRSPSGVQLGVDLEARGREVEKLTRNAIRVHGRPADVDPEDIVQEVLLTIEQRNHYPSAFNPELATFGHYVHMVAHRLILNLVQKGQAKSRIPSSAVRSMQTGGEDGAPLEIGPADDAPAVIEEREPEEQTPDDVLLERARAALERRAGYPSTWRAIAAVLAVDPARVTRVLAGELRLPDKARRRLRRFLRRGENLPEDARKRRYKSRSGPLADHLRYDGGEVSMRPLTPQQRRRVAVIACVDPKTVSAYEDPDARARMRSTTQTRVERALLKLKLIRGPGVKKAAERRVSAAAA
jgi:DNA-directed RNA polymerase specialized sigma24 family protein